MQPMPIICVLLLRALLSLKAGGASSARCSLPVIVWWTPSMFPHFVDDESPSGSSKVITCPAGQCISTKNRNEVQNWNTSTFVFYGTDLKVDDLPLGSRDTSGHAGSARPVNLWALLHEESPMNKFVLSQDAAIALFNFTATFSRHSDYPLTTLFLPSVKYLVDRPPIPLRLKNRLSSADGSSLAPLLYVQSNCDVSSDRDAYVAELAEFVPVDSFGRCLGNKKLPANLQSAEKFEDGEFLDLIANYKFHLTFENAICDDYITEKLFRALHVGSVPIYRGSKTVNDWVPGTRSVIVVDDFKTPQELAKFILEIDADDVRYEEYLTFKSSGDVRNEGLVRHLASRPWRSRSHHADDDDDLKIDFVSGYECFLCDKMHEIEKKLNAGEMITNKIANRSHLGCPAPRPSLNSGTTSQNLQEWIDNYRYGSTVARALQKMFRLKDYDSTKVHFHAATADKDEL